MDPNDNKACSSRVGSAPATSCMRLDCTCSYLCTRPLLYTRPFRPQSAPSAITRPAAWAPIPRAALLLPPPSLRPTARSRHKTSRTRRARCQTATARCTAHATEQRERSTGGRHPTRRGMRERAAFNGRTIQVSTHLSQRLCSPARARPESRIRRRVTVHENAPRVLWGNDKGEYSPLSALVQPGVQSAGKARGN